MRGGLAPQAASGRFLDIQWLRGAAALLVFCEHLKNEMAMRLQGLDPSQSPLAVFPYPAGVDVFFVISGFVIAHSSAALYGREGAWKPFLLRRLARIVPLYWLITSIFLVLFVAIGSRQVEGLDPAFILGSYFFVPVANVDGAPLPIMLLGWTLNYEMMFYAVFALFVARPRRTALLLVAAALLALVGAGLILRPGALALRFWSDPIVVEFLFGILVYALVARGLRLPDAARAALALAAVVLLAIVGTPADLSHRWLLWGGPAALLVLAATAGRERRRRDARWAELAGDTSYALYLGHLLVLIALGRGFQAVGLTGFVPVYLIYPALAVALTAALSLALHLFFERPVLQVLRRRLDRAIDTGPGAEPGP